MCSKDVLYARSFAVIYTNYCKYAHNFKETIYLIMPPLPFHISFSPLSFFFSPSHSGS